MRFYCAPFGVDSIWLCSSVQSALVLFSFSWSTPLSSNTRCVTIHGGRYVLCLLDRWLCLMPSDVRVLNAGTCGIERSHFMLLM